MKIKGITLEDFVQYKECVMSVIFPSCNFKCDKECGKQVCQNSTLAKAPIIDIEIDKIIELYKNNPYTNALCCNGLEPFDSFDSLISLIRSFRSTLDDKVIIYTGYNKNELEKEIKQLQQYPNIIIKFGRFIPNRPHKFDELLGVELASDNQYGEMIS